MKLTPHLNFNGQCEAAFKFYEQTLGAKPVMLATWGSSPMAAHTPEAWHSKIIHGRIEIAGHLVMGSDSPSDMYVKPQGMTMTIGTETPEEAERVFRALGENAAVQMPLGESFFAHRFGMLTDQFGIPWMVVCERADWKENPGAVTGCTGNAQA
jgi:PhnB protein